MLAKQLLRPHLLSGICSRQLSYTSRFCQDSQVAVDEDGLPKDYKLMTLKVISRRMDNIIHRATSLSKMSTEKAIAKGDVRVNEEVVKKKAEPIEEGDDIEVRISKFEDNSDLIHCKRIMVKSLTIDPKDGFVFVVKYWKDTIASDWKEDH